MPSLSLRFFATQSIPRNPTSTPQKCHPSPPDKFTTMEVDEFDTKTTAFVSWLSRIGVTMSPKMALVDLRSEGQGRGVVAIADFEEDEVVFSIPRATVLNTQTAPSSSRTTVTSGSSEEMPNWLALTAIMLVEGSRKDSDWAPYLAILPSSLESLVFWSGDELSQLQASAVLKKVGKRSAEALFTQHLEPLALENYNIDLCHKVASIIMAYAFDIPERIIPGENGQQEYSKSEEDDDGEDLVSDDGRDEKTILSMIPLADMLNADADRNNARLCCDNEDLEMRTIKPIAKGEEIFNDYGQLPQSDLLRRYGYVTDNYARYDVVEIPTDSFLTHFRNNEAFSASAGATLEPFSMEQWEKRRQLAERENVYEESYDLFHQGPDGPSIPDELLALLYLFLVDDDTLAAIETSQSVLPSRSKMATELMGNILATLLVLREKEYGTTLEEDIAFLEAGNLSHRKIMAIRVRVGEKKILREAISEAMSFTGTNKKMRIAGISTDNQTGTKRKLEGIARPKKKGRKE